MSSRYKNKTFVYSGSYVYKRLVGYAKRYWQGIAIGVVATILMSVVDAGFTAMVKPLLDKGLIAKDVKFLKWLPFEILVAILVRGVASFLSDYYMAWTGRGVVMRMRQEIFRHLMRLPARFYDNTTSGQLLSTIIYNVDQVAKASTDAIVTVVQESFLIVFLIGVMFHNSVRLTFLFIVTVPAIAFIARTSSKRMRKLSGNVQSTMGGVAHVAEESIEGYKVIRIFGGENYEIEKFDSLAQKNRFRELKIIATKSLASSLVQFIAGCVIALMIFFGTRINISPGGFVSTVTAMLAMLKPLRNLTNVNNTIQKGIAGAESVFLLLDKPAEKDSGTIKIARVKGKIAYQNIDFNYLPEKKILQNINFSIEPGQTIALVGRSGSGKSTLVNLLPRFYDEYSGNILIDDINTRDIELMDLRNQFAFVSQHVTLFNDTIANNIAYGRLRETSEQDIIAAATAAHAMEFIKELPDGLNTLVGENGVLLSGGQRQRIAIARALLKNAPILILDEATSALDTEAERYIQDALEQLIINRTTLVIAHRLSTIEKADKIIVLNEGIIVEAGTHAELLKRDDFYAKLYKMQFKDA